MKQNISCQIPLTLKSLDKLSSPFYKMATKEGLVHKQIIKKNMVSCGKDIPNIRFSQKATIEGKFLDSKTTFCDKTVAPLHFEQQIADLINLWLLYSVESCRVVRKVKVFIELFGARIEFTMTATSDSIQSDW